MGVYKVLKDFPSRNGVKQYEAGTSVQLDDNSRTKALIEMGFIEKDTDSYAREDAKIIAAIAKAVRPKHVRIGTLNRHETNIAEMKPNCSYYIVEVEG